MANGYYEFSAVGELSGDEIAEDILESLGRVSIECLNDRQVGRCLSIEHYAAKYPKLDSGLLRQVLEPTILLHKAAKCPSPHESNV